VPTDREIKTRLSDAETLYKTGAHEAAFLLVWSLLEAAARRLAAGQGSVIAGPREAVALVKGLVALGVVEQEEFEGLVSLATLRNAIAHGGIGVAVPEGVFKSLTALVRRVLEECSVETISHAR
jgi:uncharacterized protein YutE (UPF0331/DUF86 family)